MRRLGLGVLITLTLCGSAFASDPVRVCGNFKVFESPDAVRYVGEYEKIQRPYTVVIAERLEDGRALVFYVYGKTPKHRREGCIVRVGRFKDDGLLFVHFNRLSSLTLHLNKASAEYIRRDRDGDVRTRLIGSLEKQ